jgi:hypothetical protein
MANNTIISDCTGVSWIGMNYGIVLNVGVFTDGYSVCIASEYSTKPDVRIFFKVNVTGNRCSRQNYCLWVNGWA